MNKISNQEPPVCCASQYLPTVTTPRDGHLFIPILCRGILTLYLFILLESFWQNYTLNKQSKCYNGLAFKMALRFVLQTLPVTRQWSRVSKENYSKQFKDHFYYSTLLLNYRAYCTLQNVSKESIATVDHKWKPNLLLWRRWGQPKTNSCHFQK